VGKGVYCKMPAIARISGRFEARHLCNDHLQAAIKFYEGESLAGKEDIEYLTARKKTS
jgi:hypothetical protein